MALHFRAVRRDGLRKLAVKRPLRAESRIARRQAERDGFVISLVLRTHLDDAGELPAVQQAAHEHVAELPLEPLLLTIGEELRRSVRDTGCLDRREGFADLYRDEQKDRTGVNFAALREVHPR